MREPCIVFKLFTEDKALQDIWSSLKHHGDIWFIPKPKGHWTLVLSKMSIETSGTCQKVTEILVQSKYPWAYVVHAKWSLILGLSKMSTLKKCPCVQTAHNVYSYFWLIGLTHKKYYHVLSVHQLCCGCPANNNLS